MPRWTCLLRRSGKERPHERRGQNGSGGHSLRLVGKKYRCPRQPDCPWSCCALAPRRAAPLTALCEPAVHDLARDLDFGPERAETLIRLACLLAELRESDPAPLARRLARRTDGIESVLSGSRFEKLMRAEGEELTALLRRAIIMADRRCNVASLACDLIYWNPSTRTRWCFHYFGADAPLDDAKETAE